MNWSHRALSRQMKIISAFEKVISSSQPANVYNRHSPWFLRFLGHDLLVRHFMPRQLQQATWLTITGYCSSKQLTYTHTHTQLRYTTSMSHLHTLSLFNHTGAWSTLPVDRIFRWQNLIELAVLGSRPTQRSRFLVWALRLGPQLDPEFDLDSKSHSSSSLASPAARQGLQFVYPDFSAWPEWNSDPSPQMPGSFLQMALGAHFVLSLSHSLWWTRSSLSWGARCASDHAS